MATNPSPSSPAVTAVMRGNRRVGTQPEARLRSALHGKGLRFRKNHPIVAGEVRVRPDIVFPRSRVAVFVDGCFWHACPDHGTKPKSNTSYWAPKLARNVERDRRVDRGLTGEGWKVVRIWEHEPLSDAAAKVLRAVQR